MKGAYKLNVTISTDEEVPKLIDVVGMDYGVDIPVVTFVEKAINKKGMFYMKAKWNLES